MKSFRPERAVQWPALRNCSGSWAKKRGMNIVRQLSFGLLLLSFLGAAVPARAQGCSLCKDATAGSAPRAREGMRRAILVLGIPAGAVFLGILVIARRIQPREEEIGSSYSPLTVDGEDTC
jgi:hypothetical protein